MRATEYHVTVYRSQHPHGRVEDVPMIRLEAAIMAMLLAAGNNVLVFGFYRFEVIAKASTPEGETGVFYLPPKDERHKFLTQFKLQIALSSDSGET